MMIMIMTDKQKNKTKKLENEVKQNKEINRINKPK